MKDRQPPSAGNGLAIEGSKSVYFAGSEENPMKSVPALAFLFVSSVAYAQTTGTPAPATPPPATDDGGGLGWLWLLALLAIIGAAVGYFMKKRRGAKTASDVAGVNRTAAGTTTRPTTTGSTSPSNPPAGPNVYPAKDPKDLKH